MHLQPKSIKAVRYLQYISLFIVLFSFCLTSYMAMMSFEPGTNMAAFQNGLFGTDYSLISDSDRSAILGYTFGRASFPVIMTIAILHFLRNRKYNATMIALAISVVSDLLSFRLFLLILAIAQIILVNRKAARLYFLTTHSAAPSQSTIPQTDEAESV